MEKSLCVYCYCLKLCLSDPRSIGKRQVQLTSETDHGDDDFNLDLVEILTKASDHGSEGDGGMCFFYWAWSLSFPHVIPNVRIYQYIVALALVQGDICLL